MSNWKPVLYGIAIFAVLWMLYPARQLGPRGEQDGVVEVVFMGPNSTQPMLDAFREFEKWSERRHAADPAKPVYRVISGQSAARDQVADPTRFLVAAAGGAPPDVIYFDRYAVAEWAARGAFIPQDDYIARDVAQGQQDPPPPTADRFYQPCWDEATYRGKVYAIPAAVDDRALFYNKDMLVRARLVDAQGNARPPRTWEELRDYALKLTVWEPRQPARPAEVDERTELVLLRALTRTGGDVAKLPADLQWVNRAYLDRLSAWIKDPNRTIKTIGFIPNYGNSWLYFYGWMNGGEFMSPDGARVTLNDPKIVTALQYMRDIYDDLGGYSNVLGYQAGFQRNELDPFIQGKVAMKIDGQWALSNLANYGIDTNFGVAPPPLPAQEIARRAQQGIPPLITWCGGWAYAIPATARHKDAGWEFIRFMASERAIDIVNESTKAWTEAQGRLYLPNQSPQWAMNERMFAKYVLGNPELPRKFVDGDRVFNDLLPYARFRPVTPVGQRLWNEHVRAMENALFVEKTRMTPQMALDLGTREVQRELDKFNHPPTGTPIRDWRWFFLLYPAVLVGLGVAVYHWDTHLGFRSRLRRLFRLSKQGEDSIIEGARGGYFRKRWWEGYVCAAPWIIGFIVFGGGPMLFSLIISFTDYDILKPPVFIGLQNYTQMFTQDKQFPVSLGNTAFMMIGVPLGMMVSLAVALLLNLKIRGMAVWRTFFYLPAIVPMVAASVLWVWIFNPQGGLINQALGLLHLKQPLLQSLSLAGVKGDLRWLQDPVLSKPSIIIMGLWGAGASMIIWLAGLKGIPNELYEAADVDGANEWQKLWKITIPQLTPYIFFNLTMGLIHSFQIFGQAFIMTQGGPADSTLFYVYHLFNNAFRYGHMGYAAAMAWVLFAIVLAVTVFQLKFSKRWVYYESE